MTTTRLTRQPDVSFRLDESGAGGPALVLHGGGGPATVAGLAAHLAGSHRTITPTHPGWDGTLRPDRVDGIDDLAALYLDLLEERDLRDVLVVGSSIGGWIGAEMAVRDATGRDGRGGRISRLVLVDAMGIAVDGEEVTDFFALDARGIVEHSFHDPDRFYVDPADVPAEQAARQRANIETLRAVVGDPSMHDPALRARLASIDVPTLVVWGDSDGIASPAYGRAYAASIPGARFELVRDAGHLPQLEQPEATYALLDAGA